MWYQNVFYSTWGRRIFEMAQDEYILCKDNTWLVVIDEYNPIGPCYYDNKHTSYPVIMYNMNDTKSSIEAFVGEYIFSFSILGNIQSDIGYFELY